jgi:hypothetical protein
MAFCGPLIEKADMTSDKLISREEVLAGLPARRASTLLFLIESRIAHMVAQSRRVMEIFLTEEAAEERDLAFIEAFALGRDPPLRPTIQDLERYAPQWAFLVPENPRVRAAVAHLLCQKYDFTHQTVPGVVYRFLGHPLLITSIYFVFLASIFLHGLVIWQGTVERVGTLFVGVLMLGVTIAMVRRGAFAPRIVVELWEDLSEGEQAVFAITAGGQPGTAEVGLGYPEGEQRYQSAAGEVPALSLLRYAIFQLPAEQVQELKVWAHRVTPEGDSESLSALLEVRSGSETTRYDLKLSGGQVLLPLTSEICRLEIILPEPSS